ncbi:ribonuclease 2 [Olea europaea var. sylvestris]|uniref:Ribonuclease 2 n=1 Tax=Olea europaea subsp. europaea TaxID=158383 RepID=A0A8S0S2A5_OLEEU|nr:ribonuclease 2 [Olea europaea var. sylvestris]CAA2985824.1 ribonuclease 2 [Olea europaea subsp. europaea]
MASLLNRSIQLVLFSVLSIGLFCIGEINADWNVEAVLGGGGGDLKKREFDYFKLSLQWPGTVCRHTKHCCSSNGCCRGSNAPVEFTIHGLWPDYNDGTWPSCCSGHRFNVKEIWTLLDALNKYWPSFSCSSVSDCHGRKGLFWGHEWEKHGTCSSSVTYDEYNYFLTTLNLYFKYNVTEVLREEGYVASNTEKYPVGGIISAIQNAFHATPEIQCKGDAVEELRLCFYKDFEPRDCADDSNRQSDMVYSKASCPRHVSLPAYVSSRLENSGTEVSSPTLKSSI